MNAEVIGCPQIGPRFWLVRDGGRLLRLDGVVRGSLVAPGVVTLSCGLLRFSREVAERVAAVLNGTTEEETNDARET